MRRPESAAMSDPGHSARPYPSNHYPSNDERV